MKKVIKKSQPKNLLLSKVVLVHTVKDNIVRAIATPQIVKLAEKSFIKGKLISPESAHFDNNKQVMLNLDHVITITEFESAEEFMGREKRGQIKLLGRKANESD